MFGRIEALSSRGVEVVDGRQPTPLDARDFSALIVSGSAHSVLERTPWMLAAIEVIRDFAAADRAVLGVCFGHQLIAAAFGGAVKPSTAGLQSSTHELTLTQAGKLDPLFLNVPPTFTANLSHRDEIEAGGDIDVLALGPHSIEAIAVGDRIRGVQFHPEFSQSEARAYADYRRDELALNNDVDDLIARAADTPMAIRVVENFLNEMAH